MLTSRNQGMGGPVQLMKSTDLKAHVAGLTPAEWLPFRWARTNSSGRQSSREKRVDVFDDVAV